MTIAEQLLEKGRGEGREKGRGEEKVEVATKLFSEGMSIDFVAKITGLPMDELHKLKIKES